MAALIQQLRRPRAVLMERVRSALSAAFLARWRLFRCSLFGHWDRSERVNGPFVQHFCRRCGCYYFTANRAWKPSPKLVQAAKQRAARRAA